MEYRYGKNDNYEDFSSGRVLYHQNGVTNFPVRLAQELYGRCLEHSIKKEDICLYDCCCGGGYLLTVLGFLNQDTIGEIIGSDINSASINIAKKNLSLLSYNGINQRILEIQTMVKQYGKQSHLDAEKSATHLKNILKNRTINTHVFIADALQEIKLNRKPDIIIVDVPYGELVCWKGSEQNYMDALLTTLSKHCHANTILCICMDKKQKLTNPLFIRLEKQVIGKRKFEILIKNKL
jgi:23S rRNA G2445 N2-methylase RlmL